MDAIKWIGRKFEIIENSMNFLRGTDIMRLGQEKRRGGERKWGNRRNDN